MVDRHQVRRAEHASIVRVDDGEGRTHPGGEAGGHAREVLARVLPGVRTRDERPARDVRVLADLDEPVDVAGLKPTQGNHAVAERRLGKLQGGDRPIEAPRRPDGRRRVAPARPPAARSAHFPTPALTRGQDVDDAASSRRGDRRARDHRPQRSRRRPTRERAARAGRPASLYRSPTARRARGGRPPRTGATTCPATPSTTPATCRASTIPSAAGACGYACVRSRPAASKTPDRTASAFRAPLGPIRRAVAAHVKAHRASR